MKSPGGLMKNVQVGGAVLLTLSYLQNVMLTLQSMSFQKDEQGLWHVFVKAGAVSKQGSWVVFLLVLCGIIAFVAGFIGHKSGRRPEVHQSRLTLRHLFLAFGWVGVLFFGYLILFAYGGAHLLPAGVRNSPGLTSLNAVSMQIAAIVMVPLYYRKSLPEIGLQRPVISWRMIGYVLMFFVMVYAMSLVTGVLGAWLGVNTNSYREQYISQELHAAQVGSLLVRMLPVIATALIAPVGEELLFRGVLQSTLTAKYGNWVGVFGSAFFFALIHADLVLFVPIFAVGILFAVLRRMTGSLWAPIWLHMLNNLYASLSDLF